MPQIKLEYLFESEDELRAHLGGKTRAVAEITPTAPPAADPSEITPNAAEPELDVDGMPWDGDYHASTKTKNSDGTWKARQGKAQEAKDARAAFKAQGGTEEPPAPSTLPGATKAPATSELPGVAALPADAPEPVSWDRMVEKITGMLSREMLTSEKMMELYSKHGGENPVEVLETNETARAALFAELCEIEPELS